MVAAETRKSGESVSRTDGRRPWKGETVMKFDAAYARQSVEKQNSLSLSGQLDLCRRAAGERELRIYQDAGYSGKNTQRPAFQRLLQDIQSDRVSKLYVYRLDRFSRSVADFGRLWEILQAHQVEFVSVSEQFDTSTPMGRAMLHIIMVFAQLERETTAQRVRDNYYRRIALGAWPGGPAPYGFRRGKIQVGGRKIPGLLLVDQAEIVLQMYRTYGEEPEMSLRLLAKKLTDSGLLSPAGKYWDSCGVSRVLHNPVYVMADEQVRLHYLGMGARVVSPPEAFDGQHGLLLIGGSGGTKYTQAEGATVSVLNSMGIVPAELWLRCQRKLAQNRQIGNLGRGTRSWLSGLMKCARCGYSINVAGREDKRRLLCSGRYNRRCCTASIRVSLTLLEERVERELNECLAKQPELRPEEGASKQALEELDQRADRLVDAFAWNPEIDSRYLQRALSKLERERKRLEEVQKRETSLTSGKQTVRRFSDMSFTEKKTTAARFIELIEVDENEVKISWSASSYDCGHTQKNGINMRLWGTAKQMESKDEKGKRLLERNLFSQKHEKD